MDSPEARQPLTDSPWFWAVLFSLCGMAALVAIQGKYGRRQSTIEQKFQARQNAQLRQSPERADTNSTTPAAGSDSDREMLIPLWPLMIVLAIVAILSAAKLTVERRRHPGAVGVEQ